VKQPGGKVVTAWAVQADCDVAAVKSNTFIMEWPPRSGREREFPEIDRAAWLPIRQAREKILKGQAPLLDQLEQLVT
jgi:predicted NUDIX family NTP pyrophosphohydrolase